MSAGEADEIIALDRAASVRSVDQDGHLHVARTNISKANVCGYYGREIPGADAIGWKPDQLYQLLRDPVELQKAADSFNGKPLLNLHKPQTAQDHDHDLTVGAVNNVQWNDPYLTAELTVWDGDSINDIESGAQKELSSAYRYEVDPTPGIYKGVRYDGVMRKLRGNHVALVKNGRAGADVVVGDSAIPDMKGLAMANDAKGLSRSALFASGALVTYLRPKLAQDQKLDVAPLLKDVTKKTFTAKKGAIVSGLKAAVQGKLAQDASLDDAMEVLDKLDDILPDDGEPPAVVTSEARHTESGNSEATDKSAKDAEVTVEEALAVLKDKLTEDEFNALKAKVMGDRNASATPAAAEDKGRPVVTKTAMDAAIAVAVRETEQRTIARLNAMNEAREAVRPHIGDIKVAMDSAESIYKLALDTAKVDLTGVPPAAYGALVRMLPKPGEQQSQRSLTRVAMDAASADEYGKMFPDAGRLGAH